MTKKKVHRNPLFDKIFHITASQEPPANGGYWYGRFVLAGTLYGTLGKKTEEEALDEARATCEQFMKLSLERQKIHIQWNTNKK